MYEKIIITCETNYNKFLRDKNLSVWKKCHAIPYPILDL